MTRENWSSAKYDACKKGESMRACKASTGSSIKIVRLSTDRQNAIGRFTAVLFSGSFGNGRPNTLEKGSEPRYG